MKLLPRTLALGVCLIPCLATASGCSDNGAADADGSASGGTASGGAAASGGQSASGGAASGGQSASGGSATDLTGIDESIDSSTLTWSWANATNYTSYPDIGSEECTEYNGCKWAGYFAAVDGKMTEEWVENHNIIAMFSAGDENAAFDSYQLKTLRLRKNGHEIDVTVYDTCGDDDCDGCCTENASQNGYNTLIDLESYTYARFGQGDGPIEWACIDCN